MLHFPFFKKNFSILERVAYFTEETSMLVLGIKKQYTDFDMSFDIRPQVKTAPLAIAFGKTDFISIAIRAGVVESR